MKQYIVIAGACPCVSQNRVLNFGEVVDETFLAGEQIQAFIDGGFIKEQTAPAEPKKKS